MRRSFLFIACAFGILPLCSFAQNQQGKEYIDKYRQIAVIEMKRSGVPASITLAQGILESNSGASELATKANNHFGIKCHSDWTGKTFYKDDDKKDECFRKYDSPEDSYRAHSDFLKNTKRYSALFQLKAGDYKGWAKGLKDAGYATDPSYPERLINIIDIYKLYSIDDSSKGISLGDVDNVFFDAGGREIFVLNRIRCIKAKKGDTFFKIAKEMDLMLWQLYNYNDLPKDAALKEGQLLFLQPKRNSAERQFEIHVVQTGETMNTISQLYGVKLKKLFRKNNLPIGSEIKPGDNIWLRKRRPAK